MKSFDIEAVISGQSEKLLVVPVSQADKTYRLIKDGVEICTLKENGELGWEVNGTPLNAEELNVIGEKIKQRTSD
jgi:hypothetical protein